MKLTNIYEELLNEDFKSQTKKFIAQGFDAEIVKSYIDKFKHIRDKKYRELFDVELKVDVPSEKRNDIDSYKNFHDLEIVVDYVGGKRPVSSAISKTTNDIDVSGDAVYRDKNVEVFYADNPRACIKYKGSFPYSWCVARSDSSNMFYTYRFKPYEPAFYFVKDIQATKDEFKIWNLGKNVFRGQFQNKYHFFVIQVPKNVNLKDLTTKQYIVSSAENDGDTQMSWNEILAINPNLGPAHEVLQPKPFSDSERKQHERFTNGISDMEFKKLSYEEKRNYLDIYPTISRPITNNQLMQLPDDLLNLYVSFGIGLDDEAFAFIKNKPAILKRYGQISKRKFDEYMKPNQRNRHQLNLVYTELIMLSDEDIKAFLTSLNKREINRFIATNGNDKFEMLEKHLGDKAVSEEFKRDKDLLIRINELYIDETVEEIQERLPEGMGFVVYRGFVTLDFSDYPNGLDNLDSSITYFMKQTTDPGYWVWDDENYFEEWEEGLHDKIVEYLTVILEENEDLYNQIKSIGIVTKPTLSEAAEELISYIEQHPDVLKKIEKIIENEYSRESYRAKYKSADKICDKIREIIEYREHDDEIIIKLDAFILFIRGNEFFTTVNDDFIGNVNSIMEGVLDIYDLPDNEEIMREWVTDNDMVVDNGDIKSDIIELIEEHLEEGLYNDEDEEGDFENEDEVKRKQQLVISYLSDTLKKFGQDPYASMIENDIVRIDIDRRKFKINGQVYVKISDKENGKFHEGYIFIKDLPTYFTNHKLFEQVNKIKNIINYRK
jgi:hypothetical protein